MQVAQDRVCWLMLVPPVFLRVPRGSASVAGCINTLDRIDMSDSFWVSVTTFSQLQLCTAPTGKIVDMKGNSPYLFNKYKRTPDFALRT
jgi:hypothetical protein